MAKSKTATTTATTTEEGGFTFQTGVATPAQQSAARTSALSNQIQACPVDGSFVVDVTLDSKLPEGAEREKALGDELRKAANRVTGTVRRVKDKAGFADHMFVTRTVRGHAELGTGIFVKRTA